MGGFESSENINRLSHKFNSSTRGLTCCSERVIHITSLARMLVMWHTTLMMVQHPEQPWSDESKDLLMRIIESVRVILDSANAGITPYSVVESMLRDLMQKAKTFQNVLSEADYRTHQTVIVKSNGKYYLTHYPVDSTPQDSDPRRKLFAQIGEFFHGLQSLEGLDGNELRSKGIPVLKALSQSKKAAGEVASKTVSPDTEYLERRRKSKEDKARDQKSQENLNRQMTSEVQALEKFPKLEGLQWNEVSITFVSKDAVRVTVRKEKAKRYNYDQFGFTDRKKGDSPNSRWFFLMNMAFHGGKFGWRDDFGRSGGIDPKAAVCRIRKVPVSDLPLASQTCS